MSKSHDNNFAQTRMNVNWTRHTGSGGLWWDTADILTPHGMATAYIDERLCSVEFVWKKRWRQRVWNKAHSRRGVAILAGRFIKEIVSHN